MVYWLMMYRWIYTLLLETQSLIGYQTYWSFLAGSTCAGQYVYDNIWWKWCSVILFGKT